MGIYTNYTGGSYCSSDYRDVQPFVGESFNYHELGIIAASEIAANHNSFMKSIALSELAAVEQTGSTDVLYESVNIKGIFEKIKMFFKKIIEKIHKIFHTFIAKMSSWFGGNKSFVQKYEKEVIKGWANVSNDWQFKGFDYKKAINFKLSDSDPIKLAAENLGKSITGLVETGEIARYVKGVDSSDAPVEGDEITGHGVRPDATTGDLKGVNIASAEEIKKVREKMDDIKDDIRKQIVDAASDGKNLANLRFNLNASGGYDQKEFTEELYKTFRSDEDSKIDMNKSAIETAYNGSITAMMTFVKDFDKTKSNLEAAEKKIVKHIDDLIKKMDTEENKLIRDKANKVANEPIVQASSLYQSIWGFVSECVTQLFSALLQANKEACTQAKEIAVKTIGQSKKMTESYDYSSNSNGFDFIGSVKLV